MLTPGVLESEFCMKELQWAIDGKKTVVCVHDGESERGFDSHFDFSKEINECTSRAVQDLVRSQVPLPPPRHDRSVFVRSQLYGVVQFKVLPFTDVQDSIKYFTKRSHEKTMFEQIVRRGRCVPLRVSATPWQGGARATSHVSRRSRKHSLVVPGHEIMGSVSRVRISIVSERETPACVAVTAQAWMGGKASSTLGLSGPRSLRRAAHDTL